ncbi:AAA family ATPase [Methylobacterium oryzae]|uniref:AAA family ATPase n=1 Tax=Methylobacterium oryzae TaxID=334852 RepID=UPI002F2C04CC
MTNARARSAHPTTRALLCGARPTGDCAHRDLYEHLVTGWPALVLLDRPALVEAVGGSDAMAEFLRSTYLTCAELVVADHRLDRVQRRVFQTRLLTSATELERLLALRSAEDIELDLGYGVHNPLDDLDDRMTYHLASLGDRLAADRLRGVVVRHARRDGAVEGRPALIATMVGAEMLDGHYEPRCIPGTHRYNVVGQWREAGEEYVAQVALATRERVRDAIVEARASASEREAEQPPPKRPSPLAGFRKAVAVEPLPPAGSVVVFPALSKASAGKPDNVRDIKAALGDALGTALPGVPVPDDWDAWEAAAVARWPHMPGVPRAIREAQAGRMHWGSMRLCLVGPAGIGKTAIGRFIAEHSGLPFSRYNADNSTDNSYGGTSLRWNSGHLGTVPAMLADNMRATGLAQIDEIEKASGHRGTNGGRLHDVLHGLWDDETSSRWACPFSAMTLDLSHVAYLATANSLDGIPASLRDRMRVVEVSAPGPEHLAALVPQVAAQACREQGLDPAWGVLDGVEWQALREAWGQGGSIRRLQHLVSTILRARDADPSTPRH